MRREERDVIKETSTQLDNFIDIMGRMRPTIVLPFNIVEHDLNYLGLRCAIHDALILCDRYDLVMTRQVLTKLDTELGDQYFNVEGVIKCKI